MSPKLKNKVYIWIVIFFNFIFIGKEWSGKVNKERSKLDLFGYVVLRFSICKKKKRLRLYFSIHHYCYYYQRLGICRNFKSTAWDFSDDSFPFFSSIRLHILLHVQGRLELQAYFSKSSSSNNFSNR